MKSATIFRLREEHAESVIKHGDWNNLTIDECFKAIQDEVKELELAVALGYRTGDHSISVEALQVANVALKLYEKIMREV